MYEALKVIFFLFFVVKIFRFGLRAGLQEPSEVDFGCQKRQKNAFFLTQNEGFFVYFAIIFLAWIKDVFWSPFGPFWGANWETFGHFLESFFKYTCEKGICWFLKPLWSVLLVFMGLGGWKSSPNHIKTETKSWWKFVTLRSHFFEDLESILGSQEGHFGGRFSNKMD